MSLPGGALPMYKWLCVDEACPISSWHRLGWGGQDKAIRDCQAHLFSPQLGLKSGLGVTEVHTSWKNPSYPMSWNKKKLSFPLSFLDSRPHLKIDFEKIETGLACANALFVQNNSVILTFTFLPTFPFTSHRNSSLADVDSQYLLHCRVPQSMVPPDRWYPHHWKVIINVNSSGLPCIS